MSVPLYFTHALYFGCDVVAGLDDVDMERTSIDTELQGDIRFSVWVSFAEIYNEQIFDLLEPISKSALTKRKTMQLREDRHGNPYIKGLSQLLLSSAIEGSFPQVLLLLCSVSCVGLFSLENIEE
mgnify:CR=1 FL=1